MSETRNMDRRNAMKDLDFRTVSYRLWRLRRLILVTALLPLPGVLLASLFGVGIGFGSGGGIVLTLWLAALTALAVRFPNGWLDHFALGLPLAIVTLLSPVASILGVGPVGGVAMSLLIMFVGWLGINSQLPMILNDIPMGTSKNAFHVRTKVPAKVLQEALFLRPGAQCGLHACGPADRDGVFEVRSFGYQLLDEGLRPTEGDIAFRAKVLESDGSTQITQFFVAGAGEGTSSTTYQEITPKRKGCIYAKEEVHDHFSVLSAAGFWLNDVEADHFTATVDFVTEQPPRALKLMPQDSLMTWLMQQLMQRMAGDTA
jgi:hypothetical protein